MSILILVYWRTIEVISELCGNVRQKIYILRIKIYSILKILIEVKRDRFFKLYISIKIVLYYSISF